MQLLNKLNSVVIVLWTITLDVGKKKEGQALVEYALILGLVALVAVAVLVFLGHSVHNSLNNTANRVSQA